MAPARSRRGTAAAPLRAATALVARERGRRGRACRAGLAVRPDRASTVVDPPRGLRILDLDAGPHDHVRHPDFEPGLDDGRGARPRPVRAWVRASVGPGAAAHDPATG